MTNPHKDQVAAEEDTQRTSAPPESSRTRFRRQLALAEAMLAQLPADEPRARLLRLAIVRRDETLLAGLLPHSHPSVPLRRSTEPPPSASLIRGLRGDRSD